MARVAVGMSGGTDSSVAAALLKAQGHEVIGVTMTTWGGEPSPAGEARHGCYGPGEAEDVEDARRVAGIVGIPFHAFDLTTEYRSEVLDYFREEYSVGRTPNPCVRCNRRIKFGTLLRKVRESGIECDYFATGHYARVEHEDGRGRYLLRKAGDSRKDQSYFLCALTQEQLGRSLFPIGEYTKEQVRNMASEFGLGVEDRLESQDFFDGGVSSLLGTGAHPGPILNRKGDVLGQHRGIPFYTIGQRRGLGVAAREPMYVTSIDPDRNSIVVGALDEVYDDTLIASELNWIAVEGLREPIEAKARIRYNHQEAEAVISPLDADRVHVKFRERQMAITPGQAVVFYEDDIVIGGGTIERAA
ncbi:MAG: tRNA 2-thiouridine(34) synthase MnmA [Dehalococcoidia bacterium]